MNKVFCKHITTKMLLSLSFHKISLQVTCFKMHVIVMI